MRPSSCVPAAGEPINFVRRGGMLDTAAEVQLPNPSGNGSGRASLSAPSKGQECLPVKALKVLPRVASSCGSPKPQQEVA